jgi:hypothetical protein
MTMRSEEDLTSLMLMSSSTGVLVQALLIVEVTMEHH